MSDLQRLLELQPLGLLEPEDAARLGEGLAGDASLSSQADALSAAYADWQATVDEADAETWSADLKDRVLAAAEETPVKDVKPKLLPPLETAPEVSAEVAARIRLSCTYCHALAERQRLAYCASCLAPHHADCFAAHGHCATPGCEETQLVRPADGVPRRRRRWFPWMLSLVTITVGAAAWTGVAADKARREAARDEERALRAQYEAAQEEQDRLSELESGLDELETARDFMSRTVDTITKPPLTATRVALSLEDLSPAEAVVNLDARVPSVLIRLADGLASEIVDERVSLQLPAVHWRDALDALAQVLGCRVEQTTPEMFWLTRPQRVTIQHADTDVPGVLELVGALSGVTVEASPTLAGSRVVIDLKEVYWDEALLAIAGGACAQVWEREDGSYFVGEPGEAPAGSTPLTLPVPAEVSRGEPDDQVHSALVELAGGERPLREWMAELTRQTGLRLAIDTQYVPLGDAAVTTPLGEELVSLEPQGPLHWAAALRRLAVAARGRIERRGTDGVLTLARPPSVFVQYSSARLRTVLQLLCAYSGRSAVITDHPDINHAISLDLSGVPWRSALWSIAETMRMGVWEVGGVVIVTGPAEPAPAGARPLEPDDLWQGRPGADVTVDIQRGTVAELCRSVSRQTGARVECLVEDATALEIGLRQSPWRKALGQVARKSGCWIEDTPEGVVISERKKTILRAYDAPARSWLELVGSLTHRQLLMAPDVEGTLSLSLDGVAYLDALEASVRAVGHAIVPEPGGLLRLVEGDRPTDSSGRGGSGTTQILLAGEHVDAPSLQGVFQCEGELSAMLLNGKVYRDGEELQTGVTVKLIDSNHVQLVDDLSGAVASVEVHFDPQGRPSSSVRVDLDSQAAAIETFVAELVDLEPGSTWDLQPAAHRLTKMGEPAVEPLIAAFRDPSHPGRGKAAWTLGHLLLESGVRPQSALEALRDACLSESHLVRVQAVSPFEFLVPATGESRTVPPAQRPLIEAFEQETDIEPLQAVTELVAWLLQSGERPKQALDLLRQAALDADPEVRRVAANGLNDLLE